MKSKIKQEKGITLIALVVTIIVLLILAGISISALAGQNGLLNRAVESKEATGIAQTEEAIKVAVMDAATQGLGTITDANLKTALNNNVGAGKYEITGDETNGWTVTVDGKDYKISSTGNMEGTTSGGSSGGNQGGGTSGGNTGSLPTGTGTTPYLPDAEKFEQVTGTDLASGLVIKEKATGSEYVWVEVPRTMAVYPTAGVNISSFTDKDYTDIEKDLHTYTNDYRNGTKDSDTWYDATKDSKEANKSDWYQSESDYNTAKKKMLKSVYQNGGFWVGRYEAGIEVNRTEKGDATTVPLSKENLYPYNYVTRTQAKVLAEKVESGSYTSSLMFGVQWDLVLKFIEVKGKATQYELNEGSTTIGNYNDNLWNITNTKAKYSTDYGDNFTACPYEKNSSASVLLTTGADTSFSLMNIYDIAGNVLEWTLEKTSNTSGPCAGRGGGYNNDGSDNPASFRDLCPTSLSYDNFGFRLSLY